ncbi:MAG: hypothetical protein K9N49_00600 [Candidatus Marinimicrobia bacterium]|nr:hypothetical protein [Candidatus Neomarinimicrobiota bacterium]
MLETSNAKCTRSPVPVDAEALAALYDGIRDEEITPNDSLVRKLCEFMAFERQAAGSAPAFGTACGWVTITRDQAKAAERVAALSQGSGWCVASSNMAASYLRSSDFHLLVEGGRAKAAIRISGNSAVEIQGPGNRDPGLWWPRIQLYLNARAVKMISHRCREALAGGNRYRNQLAAIQTLRALADHLKMHPAQVQFLPEDVNHDEAYRPIIETAWRACILADPVCLALAPAWMPRDEQLMAQVLAGWRNLLNLDPPAILRMPADLQQRPDFQAARLQGWMELIGRDPEHFRQCPAELRNDPEILAAHKQGLMVLIKRNPEKFDQCPAELRNDPEIIVARKQGWMDLLIREPAMYAKCPDDVRLDSDVERALKTHWTKQLKADASRVLFTGYPERITRHVLEELYPAASYRDCCARRIKENPKIIYRIPKWVKSLPGILELIEQGRQLWPAAWAKQKKGIGSDKTIRFYNRLPAGVRNTPEIQRQYRENWLARLRRFPGSIPARCPPEFLQDPDFIKQLQDCITEYLRSPQGRRVRLPRLRKEWQASEGDVRIPLLMQLLDDIEAGRMPCTGAVDLASIDWNAASAEEKAAVREVLNRDPARMEGASASVQGDPEMRAVVFKAWLAKAKLMADADGIPSKILREPAFRDKLVKHWKTSRDLSWEDWMKCPDFVRADSEVAWRAVVPLTKALRTNPRVWGQVQSPWREMETLRREAAENWVATPSCDGQPPPEDIAGLVAELLAE